MKLSDAIMRVAPASGHSSMMVFQSIAITEFNGSLCAIACNGQVWAWAKVDGEAEPGMYSAEAIRKAVAVCGPEMKIKGGRATGQGRTFKIPTYPDVSEFPLPPLDDDLKEFLIPVYASEWAWLQNARHKDNDKRDHLKCIAVYESGAAATNTYIAHIAGEVSGPALYMIPDYALPVVEIGHPIFIGEEHISQNTTEYGWVCQTINPSGYPNLERLVPSSENRTEIESAGQLISAIKACSSTSPIRLSIGAGFVHSEKDGSVICAPCEYEPDQPFAINPKYALNVIRDSTEWVDYNGPNRGIGFGETGGDQSYFRWLGQPQRVKLGARR